MDDKDLAHLAAIVRDSEDAIIGKTLEAIITSWNKGAERIYGYTAEEAIGRTIAMLVPPDREDELPGILQKINQGEGINHYETLRVTKDGRLVNISLTISPIRDSSGTITGISSIGRDVTKQKENEAALRESARAYKLLMEQASDAIMVSYPDQPLIEVNQRASDMLGYTREELLLLRADSNALREDLTVLPSRADEIVEGDIVYAERLVRRKDGMIIVTELSTRRLDDGRIVTIARDVTERKRVEEANKKLLAEVEHERKRLVDMLSSVPGIVWETWFQPDEGSLRTSYVSSHMESMLGYTTQQWLETPNFWLEVVHPDDRDEMRQKSAERFAEGKGGTLQFRWVTADGHIIWVETTTTIIFSDDGIPIGMRGITVDITERRRIDEQIQSQAQMLNQVQAAVVATDIEGNVTHWNRFAEKLYGWQAKEVLGQRVDSFIVGPSDVALAKEIIKQVISEGWWEGEFNIRRKDGSTFPAYVIDTLLHDRAGQAIGMVGISVDITQRRRNEESINFERYLLNSLMESTPDSIYFKDLESRFTRVNHTLAKSVGLVNPREAVGKSDFDLFSGELARSAYKDEQEIIRTGQAIFSIEEHEVWADGHETWFLSTKMPLHDAQGNINGTFGVSRDITKQKEAEVSLRESEERFRLLFASNPLPMWVYDAASLQFLEVNEAAVQRYGYSREEFLSMRITDIRPPEEVTRLLANMELIRADLQFSGEWHHLTKDGELLDMQITSHTITFDGDQPGKAAILVVAEDITDRKRSEAALRASEQKFRAIFENTVDAVYITDNTGTFVDVNLAASKLAGLPAEQLVGHNYMEIKAWKTAAQLTSLVDQVMASGKASGDLQIIGASGEIRDIEYFTVANFIPGNHLSVARDLTERRRAEAALRASEIRYRTLVETSPDAITVTDLQGVIVVCNQQAVAMHGYSSIEDMMGRHAFDMLAPEDHQRAAGDMSSVAVSGVVRNREYTSIRKDGSRFPSEINGTILLDTDGNPSGIMSIMRDITEQRRAEGARLAQEAAEQANRAKSVFLSRMSHELRTPLNAILGFGQLLQMDNITHEQQESVDYIVKAGQHLLSLINEVLDIARIEEGNLTISLEPVSVKEVIHSSLDLVRSLAAHSQIKVSLGPEKLNDWYVMADRQRLQQVMLNLLANAIKYNQNGGSVSILCTLPQHVSNDLGSVSDSKLRIAVCDTGIGISAEMLTRLFVPFERLGAEQSDVEGTGLGLALSKQLVEAMGGTIGVVSEKGTGSTFWVELACVNEAVPEGEFLLAGQLEMHLVDRDTKTLLYIEDNLSNLRLIEGVLKKRPWIELITAMQGQMGLDMAYEYQPDAILLDLHLPDMSGSEVLRQLHAIPRTASIPVVILSADANQQQIDKLLNLGAQAYLTKPLNVKQLLGVLEESMTGKQAN